MKRLLSVLALVCLAAHGQTAQFPSSVATDSHLKVAANFLQTKLRYSVSASQTDITVQDATGITANMLLTIEREVVSVTSVSGSVLTVVRGFDSTNATAHSAGRDVVSYPTAWDVNALRAEIKAIETALGPSLTNVSNIATVSSTYNFSAQTPGGSLIAGSNAITMTPCPVGVNGTDDGHYLYVSGGTGTAEPVLITGGTCTSGASSGTLIFTAANTHSGAWTIRSATAGIAEMIEAAGDGASVYIAAGTNEVYAPVNISGRDGITLRGYGIGASIIDLKHPTHDFLTWGENTSDLSLSDFGVTSSVTRTGGWVLRGTGAYDSASFLQSSHIERISIENQMNGFWFTKYAGVTVDKIWMMRFVTGGGIGIKAGQTAATNENQGSELHITNTQIYGADSVDVPTYLAYAFWIEDCDAVYLGPGTGAGITSHGIVRMVAGNHGLLNHFINGFVSDGGQAQQGAAFLITGSGTLTDLMIDNSWFASAGGTTTLNADGLKIETAITGRVDIRNSRFLSNQGAGLYISGGTNTGGGPMNISNNTFTQNGLGNQSGHKDDIYLDFPFNQNAPFVNGNVHTSAPNGYSLRTSITTNLLRLGTNHWQNGASFATTPLSGLEMTATSDVIGGAPMTAGTSVSTVTSVPGAAQGMTVVATPGVLPGDGFVWQSYVSAPGEVTTKLIAVQTGTPLATGFYLRVKK
jgi:hypothetical protein